MVEEYEPPWSFFSEQEEVDRKLDGWPDESGVLGGDDLDRPEAELVLDVDGKFDVWPDEGSSLAWTTPTGG